MVWTTPLYVFFLGASGVLAWFFAWRTWLQRRLPGALGYTLVMLCLGGWALTGAGVLISEPMALKVFWAKLEMLAVASVGAWWLVFALDYSGRRRWLTWPWQILLWQIPIHTVWITSTNEWHGWFWSAITRWEADPRVLVFSPGVGFWAAVLQNYLALTVGVVLVLRIMFEAPSSRRSAVIVLILGASIFLLLNITHLAGLNPLGRVDLTPIWAAVCMALLGLSLFGVRLFDLSPLAREMLIETMSDGMLAIDLRGRVVDLNSAAASHLRLSQQVIGRPVGEALAAWKDLADSLDQDDRPHKLTLPSPYGPMLEIEILSVFQNSRQPVGRLVIFRDITERRRSEERLRQLSRAVEQSPTSVVITDLEGQITYVNPKFTELTGYTLEEAHGNNPRILKSGHTPSDVYSELWKTIRAGGEWRGEFLNRKKNGELYWELAVISGVKDEDGQVRHYVAVKEDITDRKNTEESEREQRVYAQALADTAAALNSTLDRETVFSRILENVGRVVPNEGASVILIDEHGDAIFVRASGFIEHGAPSVESACMAVEGFSTWMQMIITSRPICIPDVTQSPEWRDYPGSEWIRSYVASPIFVKSKVAGFLEVMSTVPDFYSQKHADRLQGFANEAAIALENARLYAEVERLSIVDELTRVYNFRGLKLIGVREFEHARRFGRRLSVVFFDIDHFRDFNNQYSHAVGNVILAAVAAQARASLRTVDLLARFGGEEFVALLPEADLTTAWQIAERLRRDVAAYHVSTPHGALGVTISAGVAEMMPDTTDLDALIAQANQAEHLAKDRGRNRVETIE